MMKIKTIIVPIDFSDLSLQALPYARALAESFGADITLLHVHEPLPHMSDLAWQGTHEATRDQLEIDRVTRSLDQVVEDRLDGFPLCVRTVVLNGDPGSQIVKYAEESHADLILLSTHGRRALAHLLLGSVAEHVVRKASCAVFTVKRRMEEWGDAEEKAG